MGNLIRRRQKLVEPGLQLKVIGTFVVLAGISAVLQALVLIHALGAFAGESGSQGAPPVNQVRSLVIEHLVIGLAICVPIFVVVGTFVTFRVAGPAYRFRRYLEDLARDGYSGPCVIRRGDEFQDLCAALNLAIERLRAGDAPSASRAPEPEPERESALEPAAPRGLASRDPAPVP